MSKRTKSKASKQVILGLLIISAIAMGAYAFYVKLDNRKPPDVKTPETLKPPVTQTDHQGSVSTLEPDPTPSGVTRRPNVYTFLVLGADESDYRTDVIMLAVFDTDANTLHVLHIPRDTYSNAGDRPSYHRHINLAASYKKMGDMDALIREVKHLIGYEVDGYVFVDMDGFVKLINYIGGIEFNVPQNMNYSDPTQNLTINLKKGKQTLNGKKALELMRFRSYANADIGRIAVRSDFLKAAANQILSKNNISRGAELAGVVLDNVKTSFSKADLEWFAMQALELKPENIQFDILPGGPANDSGYWIPYKKELLALINKKYNPFDGPITYIDIVDRAENKGK
jgi:LCP family protein required for cell wall assembly